jgi:hypothetical protein
MSTHGSVTAYLQGASWVMTSSIFIDFPKPVCSTNRDGRRTVRSVCPSFPQTIRLNTTLSLRTQRNQGQAHDPYRRNNTACACTYLTVYAESLPGTPTPDRTIFSGPFLASNALTLEIIRDEEVLLLSACPGKEDPCPPLRFRNHGPETKDAPGVTCSC